VLAWAGWGCAGGGGRPLLDWRQSLQDYADTWGNGDLNVVRTATDAGNRFDVIGTREGGVPFLNSYRTDANGVLVGLRRVGPRLWHVYLVGAIDFKGGHEAFPEDESAVRRILPMAVAAEGPGYVWAIAPDQPQATRRYLAAQSGPSVFPAPGDRFVLSGDGPSVTIREERTGATWSLQLEPAPE